MRLRVRYTKHGKVRWTSHRDVARMWERAFRRTTLPVAYSGGFAPRPRVSFGLALPTGAESDGEYLDVDLDRVLDDEELSALAPRLSGALPEGLDVETVAVVDERAPSLQQDVDACTWQIEVGGHDDHVATLVDQVLSSTSLPVSRERKGRIATDDIRPGIRRLRAVAPATIEADLATQPRGVRPAELVSAMGSHLDVVRVRRIKQWIERDGARREPLGPAEATSALHAQVCAS